MPGRGHHHKRLTTVRLNDEDYRSVLFLSKKYEINKADVLREAVHNGIIHLLNGEDENAILAGRLSQSVADVDGASFVSQIRKDLDL